MTKDEARKHRSCAWLWAADAILASRNGDTEGARTSARTAATHAHIYRQWRDDRASSHARRHDC